MASIGGKPGEETKKKRKKPDLPIVAIKNTADYQRMKLERLMANPDKPVNIPVRPKDKNLAPPPEFVRNIMGSSAGAGSGEFHVYRHLRRKEYARQKYIQEKAKIEQTHEEFQQKMEENQKLAEQKTAKKRARRLRKKQNQLKKRKSGGAGPGKKEKDESSSSESSSSSDEDEDSAKSNTETETVTNPPQNEKAFSTLETESCISKPTS